MAYSKKKYMSLNHIRDCLVTKDWERNTRLTLVLQFLPYWDDQKLVEGWSKTGNGDNAHKNVDNFCSGNRGSGSAVRNKNEISLIIENLDNSDPNDPDSYLRKTLSLINNWVLVTPKFTPNHEVFSLEYISKSNPTERERAFFADLKKTVDLLRQIDTEESLTYALFLIVMVGVLQEKIMKIPKICSWSFIHKVFPYSIPAVPIDPASKTSASLNENSQAQHIIEKNTSLPKHGASFIAEAIKKFSRADIESIDMAFHNGKHWIDDDDKIDLLNLINSKRIHLRVLVNSVDSLQSILPYTRRIPRTAEAQQNHIDNWKAFASENPSTVEVRISSIPLLHRTYLVRFKDNKCIADITCYTYGKTASGRDVRISYGKEDSESLAFAEEFNYLWNKA